MKPKFFLIFYCLLIFAARDGFAQHNAVRHEMNLDKHWRTVADDHNQDAYDGFEKTGYNDSQWKVVDVPHNWDDYGGYRRLRDGNRHGYAWYRKRFFVPAKDKGQRYFLWFEGVSSYATVWLNGKKVGYHAGGRTSFTLDVTHAIHPDGKNILCVRADHPPLIRDLPWVDGAQSTEPGFSEGSQPMGIFRPVHLIVTHQTRIIPFGVHIWNDTTVSEQSATLYLETTFHNYHQGGEAEKITVRNILKDEKGKVIQSISSDTSLKAGEEITLGQRLDNIAHPHLWSLKDPYLYQMISQLIIKGKVVDQTTTNYGIRWISWPINRKGDNNQFLLNGKPVYINGVAEYEHLIGQSHAFSKQQVRARVRQVQAAGFNAFRDAHQPHNLRYQRYFEKDGILWWPQFAAHIWFDTPQFRENFIKLLKDWIRERRNNPAAILWGLENESKLPKDFAEQCSDIIRKMDPTASTQRMITTCNGGSGADWNVPQNWSGTYGGDPTKYASEVQKEKLVGEYGAYRSIGLHTEGPFDQDGILSENRMTQLMEMKVRQADSVKDKFCGQFMWLLWSHDNPGRVQSGEGYRELDRVGPVNYKGLFTIWGEPVDAFYMYRANYVDAQKHPMVYIVSHTWPDRWAKPGIKNGLTVYSNCDEVELFNDVNGHSLGKRKRHGIGTHFKWDSVNIKYNVLYAVGYVNGKAVAKDCIVLNHLPKAPHFQELVDTENITKPVPAYNYLYRVDCGGPDYVDENGKLWQADHHQEDSAHWGSVSWTDHYQGMPPFYASQRRTFDPIRGTKDWTLFQTFRYGRHDLKYIFPVPDGDYRVELYFTEPWYGIGGGMDCSGWRLFDVAVNGKTKLHNVDIWKESGGADRALKKVIYAHVSDGKLVISFPKVNADQAVISAIAIATKNKNAQPAPYSESLIQHLSIPDKTDSDQWHIESWLDTGQRQYSDDSTTFSKLPPALFGAEWLRRPEKLMHTDVDSLLTFTAGTDEDVYVGIDSATHPNKKWLKNFTATKTYIENDKGQVFSVYEQSFHKGDKVNIGTINKGDLPLFLAVNYSSNMRPAFDLKPSVSYKIEKANCLGKGLLIQELAGKKGATFQRDKGDTISWHINTGLAGKYALHIQYHNPTGHTLSAFLQMISAEGSVMLQQKLQFPPAPADKWRTITTMTATRVNAGNYIIRISSINAESLSIYKLQIQ